MIVRQALAIYRLSLRRLSRSSFMIASLFLAGLPILLGALIGHARRTHIDLARAHMIHETLLRSLFLHFVVFFSGVLFGFATMRQELQEQTLHYLLLAPIRRWVVTLAKLAACLTLSAALCSIGLWGQYVALALPAAGPDGLAQDLIAGGWALSLAREAGVLALGLLAYGSLAMLMGSFFKSVFWVLLVFAWETATPYLPTLMKNWTITHYLHSLLPVPIQGQQRLFELLGEPAGAALSLGAIFGASAIFIACSIAAFQTRECVYGAADA